MIVVFAPVGVYILIITVFSTNDLLAISLHLALYNGILFIRILNEVLCWNKRVIKEKYVGQVLQQFSIFPAKPDEVSLSNFLTDIEQFKLLEDERFSVDLLFQARVNKVENELNDLSYIRSYADKITEVLFREIVHQFVWKKRDKVLIETKYPYYINTFVKKLDSYEASQLLYNPKFLVSGLEQLALIEILLNRLLQLKKEDKGIDICLNLSSILEELLRSRSDVDKDEIIILFYILLYNRGLDMLSVVGRDYISNKEKLKGLIVAEAIIDWNNYKFKPKAGEREYRLIEISKKLNQVVYASGSYFPNIDNISTSNILSYTEENSNLYAKTIKLLEQRYLSKSWTPYTNLEKLSTRG